MSSSERRSSPRARHRLPIILNGGVNELVTHTEDISSSGAYCTLSRYVPPMTKLQVKLELPGEPKSKRLTCYGVIVRIDPSTPGGRGTRYKAAIFFHDLSDHDRTVLAHYIQQHAHVDAPRP